MPLVFLACAWVAGIYLGSKFSLSLPFVFIGLAPLPLLFFAHRRRNFIIMGSLGLLAFLGGAVYSAAGSPLADRDSLQFYSRRGTIEVKGLVAADPEVGDRATRLRVAAREVKQGEVWTPVSGTVLLTVPRYPAHSYGDVLLVRGKLETPSRLGDFDYGQYLAQQGIRSIMYYPETEVLDRDRGFKLLSWIYSLRSRLSRALSEVLPEPQASLAQGVVLGIRGNIPSAVNDQFIHTGTAHLLAISGLHLSIVAGILLSLGTWAFGRRHYIYVWLALSAIWLYAILTGLQPPVVRAAIMVSVFLTADLLGRQRSGLVALVLAAAIMVGVTPQVLWQASFQMSFMAMVGLILVSPMIQAPGRKAVSRAVGESGLAASAASFVVDSLSVGLGAVIAVWPLIAYYFGIISWVGPIATFFAMFSLPGIIVSGALAGISGILLLPLAQIIAWVAWLFLSYLLLVVRVFDLVPYSQPAAFNAVWIWAYYAAMALGIWTASNWRKLPIIVSKAQNVFGRLPVKWVIPALMIVAVLVWLTAATMPDSNLRVAFLDIGQGDATLIQKGNQQVLVDGGPSPQAIASALSEKMPFWDRTIDLVVLTHPHADHLAGLVEVLRRYRVGQVLYPALPGESLDSDLYDEWLRVIEGKGIKNVQAAAGQRITMGDIVVEVLNPQEAPFENTWSDVDNNGVVLRVRLDEVSFLLTSDIMREAEFELIARRARLASRVLKVGHHGADTSTTSEFLAVVDPRLAVISAGKSNPFGHPNQEVVSRLAEKLGEGKIYRTDEQGTITFTTDGRRLWVRVER